MVPLSTLVSSRPLNGPQYFERYNVYSAATINGTNAPGYSSGQAIAAMEELARALPPGFAYEWSEATYQEKKTGGQTGYIFAVSLLFVILVLAALYESWAMPVAILLVIPFGVFGAFLGLLLRAFRQQRLHADRADHAGRTRGQERHPHRRVREAQARARRVDRTGRARRRQAQAAADPDDVVRVHPGNRSAGDCTRARAPGRDRRWARPSCSACWSRRWSACSSFRCSTCCCSGSASASGRSGAAASCICRKPPIGRQARQVRRRPWRPRASD